MFSSENCEHDLLLLQHELQETGIPIEQFQPQSYIYNEENDDFLNQSPAQVNTAATITTTTTLLVLVLLLVKSPCHVTSTMKILLLHQYTNGQMTNRVYQLTFEHN